MTTGEVSAPAIVRPPLSERAELKPSARVARIAALLDNNRFADARNEVCQLDSTDESDQLALHHLTRIVLDETAYVPYEQVEDEIRLMSRALVLVPEYVPFVRRLLSAAQKSKNEPVLLEAVRRLAEVSPDDPRLATLISSWNAGLRGSNEHGYSRNVVILGYRLEAAGSMTAEVLAIMLTSLEGHVDKIAALGQRFRAFAASGPVSAVLQQWRTTALVEAEEGRWLTALRKLRCVTSFCPTVEDAIAIAEALVQTGDVSEDVIHLLAWSRRADPDLGGLRRSLAKKWKSLMHSAVQRAEWKRVILFQDGLEAIDSDDDVSREHAIRAYLEISDPRRRLPELLARQQHNGERSARLSSLVDDWLRELSLAERNKDWSKLWSIGRRLQAAGAANAKVLQSMLKALTFVSDTDGDVIAVWLDFERSWKSLGHALPAITARAGDRIANAALERLKSGGAADLCLPTIFGIADAYGFGSRVIEAVLTEAAGVDPYPQIDALLNESTISDAVKLFVKALRLSEQGQQLAAAMLFRAAKDQGLKGHLLRTAEQELAAATFRMLTPITWPDERALVLLEHGVSPDIVHEARKLAPALDMCAPHDSALGEHSAEYTFATRLSFRQYDLPSVAAAAMNIAIWTVDRVLATLSEHKITVLPLRRYSELFGRHLFMRWFAQGRILFNLLEAIRKGGHRRIFFVVNDGVIARTLVKHILRLESGYELRVACGSRRAYARRYFSIEKFLSGPEASKSTEPHYPGECIAPLQYSDIPGLPPILVPPARNDLALPLSGMIVLTSNREDMIGPLVELIIAMSQRWRLQILFLKMRPGDEWFVSALAGNPEFNPGRISISVIDVHMVRKSSERYLSAAVRNLLRDLDVEDAPHVLDLDISEHARFLVTSLLDSVAGVEAVEGWFNAQIKSEAPRFVLFPHADLLETQLICQIARDSGIPTFWLQTRQHARDAHLQRPPAEHYLVVDRHSAVLWQEYLGIDPRNISVVGSVRIDARVAGCRRLDRIAALKSLGRSHDDRVILIATQPIAFEENVRLLQIVAHAVESISNIHIVVKLHPAEPDARLAGLEAALAKLGMADRSLVTKSLDLYPSIVASELVIVRNSNVGIEAAILRRSVLSIMLDSKGEAFSLAECGLTDEINDEKEAGERIKRLLTDPDERRSLDQKRRAYVAANAELCDGRSIGRIMATVASISERERSQMEA